MNNNLLILVIYLLISKTILADPAFSIHNKSDSNISILVWQNQYDLYRNVDSGQFFDIQDLDTKQKTTIYIYLDGQTVASVAEISPNKNIYINWDPKQNPPLYPQRGPLMGLTGKTDKGYSTRNNVKNSDIKFSMSNPIMMPNPTTTYRDKIYDLLDFYEGMTRKKDKDTEKKSSKDTMKNF